MKKYGRSVRLGISLLCLLLCVNAAYAADSQAGSWKMNIAKSSFTPAGAAPKSQMTRIEEIPNGVKNVTDIVDAQGKAIHYEFTALYDGKDHPVKGDPNRDTIAIKKVDDYTFEITNKKAGKVITTAQSVYARDGKTRTITTTGSNPQGEKVVNATVWDRQ